jgi:hypothetical protein
MGRRGRVLRGERFTLLLTGGADAAAGPRNEGEMLKKTTGRRSGWRIGVGVMLVAGSCGFLTGCSSVAYPPTYTQAELKTICDRRGGWWRGDLIPGYCEYQAASLQAP